VRLNLNRYPAGKLNRVKTVRALAIVIALALAAGCAAGVRPPPPGRALASYWTRSRLLAATPLLPGGSRVPLPGQPEGSRAALLTLRLGALFIRDGGDDHFCTASVVTSPGRDLLITAAHCINGGKGGGYRQDIVFVPDYRDGVAPFGIWTARRLLVAPQWSRDSDPGLDVGFVVLEPHDGRSIEGVLGANRLRFDPPYRQLVRVTGYPDSGDAPITCRNWTTRWSATQLRFECGGYADGTSGSPWVTGFDPRTQTGTIVGVIGGYQEGGDTASVSYSSYLGRDVLRLYREAAAAGASAAG
jgi:V8-like Glu-specific endopeptidase